MKKLTFLTASAALMFAACSEPLEEAVRDIELPTDTVSVAEKQQTILGKQIENPYSLNYMRKALEEVRKTSLSKAALNYEINANYLHVRFLPANPEEYEQLLADSTIELFDRPMLCEIEQESEAYHDPTLPEDAITWQYTTVPINYKFPKIEYEILDSCFVPEDEPETLTKSLRGFNPEILTSIAFRLAGQEYDEEPTLTKKRKVPSGQFRVWNTNIGDWSGIIGVKVKVYNGIRWDHTYTDINGNYKMSKHYATGLHYKIKFRTSDDIIINNLMFDLDAADMGLGWHSKGGYDEDFNTNSKVWMWATVNNAVYIFRKQLCPHFNIPTPNLKLHIWAKNGISSQKPSVTGSAPMGRHIDIELADWMELVSSALDPMDTKNILKKLAPDVIIYKRNTTTAIYTNVFHEMSHVCHYTSVGKWFWKMYVKYIIHNSNYGNKNDEYSGFCGVGEMWGYYFGNYACPKYYLNNTDEWNARNYWFNPGIILCLVKDAGLSERQIFDCMQSYITDHASLKNELCKKYPSKDSLIKKCFKDYGF